MRMIHLNEVHVPKGQNLFAFSVGELVCCGIALFFFLVSWAVGGSENIQDLGGAVTFGVLLAGIAIGALFAKVTRPKS